MENYDDLILEKRETEELHQERKHFDKAAFAEKRQQERSNTYALIEATLQKLPNNGELFQTYLDVQARFDRYSVNNVALITAQKPDATKLASFEKWKSAGISVNKGETAITLLEPGKEYVSENGKAGVFFHGGRLPIHVHFVMDEFANVALPDEFDKLLSTMRSREISVSIIIQNLAQLKALFEKQWESVCGNCDEFLYLGGNEQSTHEYVSKLLGKETIDLNTYGQSHGRNGSYSTNWQITGRDLLTPDEVRMLDNRYALLFIRGENPVRDYKYDILKHPNVALTADGGAAPYRHGEDSRSIAAISLNPQLLDGDAVPIEDLHHYEILTNEELEEKLLKLEEKRNEEKQK